MELTKNSELIKHYRLVEGFRIMISNWEALSFFVYRRGDMPTIQCNTHDFTPKTGRNRKAYYAVITYLLTLSIRLDNAPRLVEASVEAEGYWGKKGEM